MEDNLFNSLHSITLTNLERVGLLHRFDEKYIIPISCLPEIVRLLEENQYAVLEIDGCRGTSYVTTYFDTTDYQFYMDHHNRRKNRLKVRTRTYKESHIHYFEIKEKSYSLTKKYRERIEEVHNDLSDAQMNEIGKTYSRTLNSELHPTLVTYFKRFSLLSNNEFERCTIDIRPSFQDPDKPENIISINDIAIIEIKRLKSSKRKGIVASMKKAHFYPFKISKYVLGINLIHPEIKYNAFKPLLLKIDKVKKQEKKLTCPTKGYKNE